MRVLTGQIQHALAFAYPERDPNGRAVQAAQAFLTRLPEVRALAATDVEAAYAGDPALRNRDEAILCYPGLLAVTRQRLAHELWMLEVPLLPRIITEAAHSDTGIDIHPGASIGEAFFVDHGTSVVIGETARIGKRVRIYQGVTLGALSLPTGRARQLATAKRHPTIEDDVIIYANATILGGDTVIGRAAVIGGNCWVTASVAPGARLTVEDPSPGVRRSVAPKTSP
jgi:serine O-acetyltransferase